MMKNTRFTYHSILKYFSALNLHIHCMIAETVLHPSKAGMGSILNNARAKDINHISHSRFVHSLCKNKFHITLVMSTGHESLSTDSFILSLSKDAIHFQIFHNEYRDICDCALSSCNHKTIACLNGTLIVIFHDDNIDIHNKHSFSGHFHSFVKSSLFLFIFN